VIALWLGHESVETTQVYLDANLALIIRRIFAKVRSPNGQNPGLFILGRCIHIWEWPTGSHRADSTAKGEKAKVRRRQLEVGHFG